MIPIEAGADAQDAPWSKWERLGLGVAMLMTALLTVPGLDQRSFWFDEVCTIDIARTWSGMYHTFGAYENNMALYYVLLHGWMALVGDGEGAVRFLSVLFALATLPVVHALARRVCDARAAIIADLLMVANLPFLTFAQEARSYSLLVLLSALTALLFVMGLRRPRWPIWMGFSAVAAASVYAHYFGLFNAAACFAAAFLSGCWPGRARLPWRHLLVAGVVMGLLLVPLVLVRPPDGSQVNWIVAPDRKMLSYTVTYLAGGTKLTVYACILWLGCGLWGLARSPPQERTARSPTYVLLFAWLLLPALAALTVSLLIKPIFMPKYLLGSVPALVILVAAGIARLPKWWAVAAVAAMLLPNANAIRRDGVPTNNHQDWRGLVTTVAAAARPGDCAICQPFFNIRCVRVYLARQPVAHPDLEPYELASAPYHPGGGTAEPAPDLGVLDQLCRSHARIWLIIAEDSASESREKKEHLQAILARLGATYRTQTTFHAEGVQALLFAEPR